MTTDSKKESEIRQQLKQVVFRHRKSFIDEHLRPIPSNCSNNAEVQGHSGPLPILRVCRKEINGVWNNVVCDSRFGGDALAALCPYFCPKKDAAALKQEFKEEIEKAVQSDLPLGLLAQRYPDIVALLWVLGRGTGALLEAQEDVEAPGTTP